MQNVNLLDLRLVPAAPSVSPPMALLGVAVLAGAALAVLVHGSTEQRLLNQALAALDASQAQTQTAATPDGAATGPDAAAHGSASNPAHAAQDALRQSVAQREALLAALQRESPGPSHPAQTLNSVLQALPANVWLNELELHGASSLRIAGGTLDPHALAQYAHQLARAPALRGTSLKTVRLEAVAEPGAVSAETNTTKTGTTGRSRHHFELASAPPAGARP
jgi:Tfp pilus assembly protein PilN